MKQITVMIKPASSLCNMRCRYCFYADVSSLREVNSFGIMKYDVLNSILEHVFVDLGGNDHLTLAFQGGEPTLVGLNFYRGVIESVNLHRRENIQVSYAIQTNGLLLDHEWCQFLKDNRFLVGLSLDGPSDFHNANRLDESGKGTFRRILKTKQELDHAGVDYNILTVLTRQMARHPRQIWRMIQKENLRHIQFVPCLGPLDGQESIYGLTPAQYAEFYKSLFDLWFSSFQRGDYYSIKLFDDLINLLAYGQCNACGLLGYCQPQIIVEADGGVYPCDFYVLDQYRIGNLTTDSLRSLYESPAMSHFLARPAEDKTLCGECAYRDLCNGGCQRMRREVFYTPGAEFCGQRDFLGYSIVRLRQIALRFRQTDSFSH